MSRAKQLETHRQRSQRRHRCEELEPDDFSPLYFVSGAPIFREMSGSLLVHLLFRLDSFQVAGRLKPRLKNLAARSRSGTGPGHGGHWNEGGADSIKKCSRAKWGRRNKINLVGPASTKKKIISVLNLVSKSNERSPTASNNFTLFFRSFSRFYSQCCQNIPN